MLFPFLLTSRALTPVLPPHTPELSHLLWHCSTYSARTACRFSRFTPDSDFFPHTFCTAQTSVSVLSLSHLCIPPIFPLPFSPNSYYLPQPTFNLLDVLSTVLNHFQRSHTHTRTNTHTHIHTYTHTHTHTRKVNVTVYRQLFMKNNDCIT